MTQTLGDLTTARTIFKHCTTNLWNDKHMRYARAPVGFNRIGSGISRVAYLHKPSSVVYKYGDKSSNLNESQASRRLARRSTKSLGFDVRIPRTRTYNMANDHDSIAAQEFVKGRPTYCRSMDIWREDVKCTCGSPICFKTVIDRISDWSQLEDIHDANVLVDGNSTFWIIDMAD